MREKGIDYFENSRRATLAQRAYAIANPGGFAGYGEDVWGLTACDGPADVTLDVNGRRVRFFSYAARGAGAGDVRDDGTLAPAAAAGSLPFTPELSVKALRTMVSRWGGDLYGPYGFRDAFNPTFTFSAALRHGRVVAAKGLVRRRRPRDRPGPDPRDDRESAQRSRVENDAEEPGDRARPRPRRLHGRMARGRGTLTRAGAVRRARGPARGGGLRARRAGARAPSASGASAARARS